eukprot:6222445-Alexandrium_andersonii.AAC.1
MLASAHAQGCMQRMQSKRNMRDGTARILQPPRQNTSRACLLRKVAPSLKGEGLLAERATGNRSPTDAAIVATKLFG